jgi:hypothetical protein
MPGKTAKTSPETALKSEAPVLSGEIMEPLAGLQVTALPVVGRGIDPRTSRFSGARSTN